MSQRPVCQSTKPLQHQENNDTHAAIFILIMEANMPHRELTHFAVSVVGADRPGIVAGITEALYKLGCNIADSSCAMLVGEFAMILIISRKKPFTKPQLQDELKPVLS